MINTPHQHERKVRVSYKSISHGDVQLLIESLLLNWFFLMKRLDPLTDSRESNANEIKRQANLLKRSDTLKS